MQPDIESINQVWANARTSLRRLREERDAARENARAAEAALKAEAAKRAEAEAALSISRANASRIESLFESMKSSTSEKLSLREKELTSAKRKLTDVELALEEERALGAVRAAEIAEFEASLERTDRLQKLEEQNDVIYSERTKHLETQLSEALVRIESQQAQIAEARAAHAEVLSKIAGFESEIIALRSTRSSLHRLESRNLLANFLHMQYLWNKYFPEIRIS